MSASPAFIKPSNPHPPLPNGAASTMIRNDSGKRLRMLLLSQYSVGFEVLTVSTVGDPGPNSFQRKSSGDYRVLGAGVSRAGCGFCYLEVDHVPAGIYNVIPTTFLPKQEGPFFLDFSSTTPLRVSQLQQVIGSTLLVWCVPAFHLAGPSSSDTGGPLGPEANPAIGPAWWGGRGLSAFVWGGKQGLQSEIGVRISGTKGAACTPGKGIHTLCRESALCDLYNNDKVPVKVRGRTAMTRVIDLGLISNTHNASGG
ncbi:hypothetical protein JZ751_009641 [Albula glossodonta]|uniref:Peptidase C2 calpain domain-containing protein n=1 Tax=Albula glossodonta TaxID=121402 RepID=A0A8T2P069_9TELE|nr:hypothetical protein JZ751_009641 [Albula glossodonta]